jgi:hypothetical protein
MRVGISLTSGRRAGDPRESPIRHLPGRLGEDVAGLEE